MIAPADRHPIIVADAAPLIRLAAAGILDTLRGLNRWILLVDQNRRATFASASGSGSTPESRSIATAPAGSSATR